MIGRRLLTNVRAADGADVEVLIEDGTIARLATRIADPAHDVERIDGNGELLLPALVDGHVHLDKTLTGSPWRPHQAGPDRASRIETEMRIRDHLPPVAERAANLIRQCIAFGTRAIRTHVDVTPELGLSHLHAIADLRRQFADRIEIQIVAFPQTGVLCQPGSRERLTRALEAGADLIGGIDPITFDGDVEGQIDLLFELAMRYGAGVDVHVHDPGARGANEIAVITERCRRHGMAGGVTVSHGFALATLGERDLDAQATLMAEAGVSLATHGGGASPLPPVKRLREIGVNVFAGNDDVRDPWSPYGNGDMLERAMLLAWRSGFRTDEDLGVALECASHAGALALGLDAHGPAPGRRADLITVPSETVAEAVVSRPVRGLVLHAGRIVARNGVEVHPLSC